MEKIIEVAKYIAIKHRELTKNEIDQMRLHKLTFFIQKESFFRTKLPMFEEDFFGWRYGPVSIDIRKNYNEIKKYKGDTFVSDKNKDIIDYIFEKYIDTSSVELSELSHLELSWLKSRIGVQYNKNGNEIILKKDILYDALQMRKL